MAEPTRALALVKKTKSRDPAADAKFEADMREINAKATTIGIFYFNTLGSFVAIGLAAMLYAVASRADIAVLPLSKWLRSPSERSWAFNHATLTAFYTAYTLVNVLRAAVLQGLSEPTYAYRNVVSAQSVRGVTTAILNICLLFSRDLSAGLCYDLVERAGAPVLPMSQWPASPFDRRWTLTWTTTATVALTYWGVSWLQGKMVVTFMKANLRLRMVLGMEYNPEVYRQRQ